MRLTSASILFSRALDFFKAFCNSAVCVLRRFISTPSRRRSRWRASLSFAGLDELGAGPVRRIAVPLGGDDPLPSAAFLVLLR